MLFNPFIEVIDIKVYPLAYLYHRKTTGPHKLTDGGDRPPQVNGSLLNGKKPLFKGFPLGICNPVRLYNFLFFQTYLPICALNVPKINLPFFLFFSFKTSNVDGIISRLAYGRIHVDNELLHKGLIPGKVRAFVIKQAVQLSLKLYPLRSEE